MNITSFKRWIKTEMSAFGFSGMSWWPHNDSFNVTKSTLGIRIVGVCKAKNNFRRNSVRKLNLFFPAPLLHCILSRFWMSIESYNLSNFELKKFVKNAWCKLSESVSFDFFSVKSMRLVFVPDLWKNHRFVFSWEKKNTFSKVSLISINIFREIARIGTLNW